jgi:hypothetical protein
LLAPVVTAERQHILPQVQQSGWRLERYDRRFTPSVDNPAWPDNAFEILVPLRN